MNWKPSPCPELFGSPEAGNGHILIITRSTLLWRRRQNKKISCLRFHASREKPKEPKREISIFLRNKMSRSLAWMIIVDFSGLQISPHFCWRWTPHSSKEKKSSRFRCFPRRRRCVKEHPANLNLHNLHFFLSPRYKAWYTPTLSLNIEGTRKNWPTWKSVYVFSELRDRSYRKALAARLSNISERDHQVRPKF